MKKIFLSLFFFLATQTGAMAAKSAGIPRTIHQPDGTAMQILLLGDENFSWYQTTDGVLLVEDNNVFYVAKTNYYGSISSTGIIAHEAALRTQEELSAIGRQDKDIFFSIGPEVSKSKFASSDFSLLQIPNYPSTTHCPHTGRIRIPIIMMEYPDQPFSFDREVYEQYFNGTTRTPLSEETKWNGYSSVSEFFKDASFGLFEPIFELYGPYTTNHAHYYYGKATPTSYSDNKITLLREAVQKADKDIDFSQYDSDNNGKVDMVYVFYTGTGANISGDYRDVWPACYPGNQNISTSDGVIVNTIGCANELAIYASESPTGESLRAGTGVTIHEMSHGLGLPDLYNTGTPKNPVTGLPDYSNCGPEDWDIMDGGENLYNAMWPCQYTAWERDVLGWMDIEELTESEDITIYPLNDKEGRGKAYRITNPANPNEYYIIENNCVGEWNQYQNNQYGTGLMIYHLNGSSTGFSMTPNNTYGKPNITILPADGYIMGLYNSGEKIMYNGVLTTMPKKDSEFRSQYFNTESQGDPYPGLKKVTALRSFKNYSGPEMSEIYGITDIRKNEDGSIYFHYSHNH